MANIEEITEAKDWKNNIEIVRELYQRIESAFEKRDLANLYVFQEDLKGIEKDVADKIEDLKDDFKRNDAVNNNS